MNIPPKIFSKSFERLKIFEDKSESNIRAIIDVIPWYMYIQKSNGIRYSAVALESKITKGIFLGLV